jgi:ABC-type dipeptide/oligopeptide/nickel transport system permease component
MHTYILRRLLLMIPTLLGITIVVFVVMAASPGGISAQTLIEGQNLEPQAKKALEDYYNKLYGLNDPAPVQYLRWLNNVSPIGFTFDKENHIKGFSFTKGSDLGTSFRYGRPVLELLKERVPITLLLNLIAIPIAYVIAIAVGVHAATERGKSFDVGSSITLLGLWSIPTMLAGVLMIGFFASDQYWRWFPAAGLSEREALDMPFMPHWLSLSDAVTVLACAIIGVVLLVLISRRAPKTVRTGVLAVLGAVMGTLMAHGLPGETSYWAYGVFALVLGALFGSVGITEFAGFRTGVMGLLGFFLGIIAAGHFVHGEFVRGFLVDRLWHLALPVICLAYNGFAFLAKLTRTSVLENLLADYARTARAKGVPEKQVLWRHVFRNSLLPLITVAASLLPGLLSGSVIVENIFSIDGMGKLAVEAVKARDRELVLSITLISGMLTLVGYLIADICYAIADPRVSYE